MAFPYKKYKRSDIKNKEGGYKSRLLFAPIDSFLVCALPAGGPALGDAKKIVADHTFENADGFIEMYGKINSATAKYTTDDDGVFTHTFQIDIEGESPELYEQLENMVADSVAGAGPVVLLKDGNCIDADSYNQWGDSCLQPTLKVEFDAKTTASGTKIQTLSGTIRGHRYWYYGTVSEKPEVSPVVLACSVITLQATNNSVTVNYGAVAGATSYTIKLFSDAEGLNTVSTASSSGPGNNNVFSGRTADTQYYVRVIPANGVVSKTDCPLVGIKTLA